MAEPVTEAGRMLRAAIEMDYGPEDADPIVDIEQEARAALLAELRAKVEALGIYNPRAGEFYFERAAVLESMEAMQRALGS